MYIRTTGSYNREMGEDFGQWIWSFLHIYPVRCSYIVWFSRYSCFCRSRPV